MNTQRFWNVAIGDRRSVSRQRVNFYGVELTEGARYLRRFRNLSERGLMMEDPLVFQRRGAVLELELPRHRQQPLRVRAEVVRVTASGQIGLRTVGAPSLRGVGGLIAL